MMNKLGINEEETDDLVFEDEQDVHDWSRLSRDRDTLPLHHAEPHTPSPLRLCPTVTLATARSGSTPPSMTAAQASYG
jgi:hypothetical protein